MEAIKRSVVGNHLAFSGMSQSWNHTACSFFRLASFTSNRHLNSLGPNEGEDYSIIYLNNGDSKDDKILRTFVC